MSFFVWRQGTRGPVASVDLYDPRQSLDWKLNEQTTVQIIPLSDDEIGLSLSRLIELHPCPQEETL